VSSGKKLFLKSLATGLLAFATAAAFAAYLKPGMLVEFANLVLCS
jgi:hypothetical protein